MSKITYSLGAYAVAMIALLSVFSSTNVQANSNNDSILVVAGKWSIPDSVKKSDGSEGAYIEITFPQDGDVIPSNKSLIAEYSLDPGEKGDHFHYYLDGEQLGSLRSRSGSLDFGMLKPGKHAIELKIANTAHILIGVEKAVTVIVK